MPCLILHLDVVQSDVQEPWRRYLVRLASLRIAVDVLVDRLEGPGYGEIILELDRNRLVRKRLEHREDGMLGEGNIDPEVGRVVHGHRT